MLLQAPQYQTQLDRLLEREEVARGTTDDVEVDIDDVSIDLTLSGWAISAAAGLMNLQRMAECDCSRFAGDWALALTQCQGRSSYHAQHVMHRAQHQDVQGACGGLLGFGAWPWPYVECHDRARKSRTGNGEHLAHQCSTAFLLLAPTKGR